MDNLEFIYKRKSIRKFKEGEIPKEDILKLLDAATQAPSPKNQQTWHFVVLQNRDIINKMAEIVTNKHIYLAEIAKEEKQRKLMMNTLPYYICFKDAPVVVIVYSKAYKMIEEDILKANNANEEVIEILKSTHSEVQGIGAAVENFLLAATAMGYGACYMTGPAHSKREIEELINFNKEGYELMAMISLGIPEEGTPKAPPRKPLDEVVTFID
ncbi:nitroreductase family protein [Clostridium sp. NSJ-49]|uniref:nitroreductase family protein n=1 Tax=Clostridium sp. NSJ-49 TaxID=2763034 RepID=UPI00164CB5D4|nr:nitroreductase family protein [Clostridium sp. NSJ-49]MBC5626245.1 nitroreductase family protein [Clostridium sp. NSJ-49]